MKMATLLLDTKYIKQPQLTFIAAVPAKLVVPAVMSRPRKGFLKTILSVWLLKPEKRNGGLWCSPANFTWNKRWEYNTYTNILFSASFSACLFRIMLIILRPLKKGAHSSVLLFILLLPVGTLPLFWTALSAPNSELPHRPRAQLYPTWRCQGKKRIT